MNLTYLYPYGLILQGEIKALWDNLNFCEWQVLVDLQSRLYVWTGGGGGRYTQGGRRLGRYTEWDRYTLGGRYTRYLSHTILTSSDDHQSGRYASYWNAFLLLNIFGLPHLQWRIQDFPEEGAPTPKTAIILQFFCQKLHENERIWTPRGGVPGAPPLDPPMTCFQQTLM